jgi:ribose transport system permease protein
VSLGARLLRRNGHGKRGSLAEVVSDSPSELRSRRVVLGQFGGLLVFLGMLVVFSLASPTVFPTFRNASNILDQAAILGILGAGLTVVLVIGEFDLSFGATIGFTGAVAALASAHLGWPIWLVLPLALVAGALIGVANGVAVAYGKAPAFIVTLAVGSVVGGLEQVLTGNLPISGLRNDFINLTGGKVLGFTSPTIISVGLVAVMWVALVFTTFGRSVDAAGQNRSAALLAGLPVQRRVVASFAIMGACAGLVGVIIVSRSAQQFQGAGTSLLLPPYAAAFLGAAVVGYGRFGAWRTLFGVIFIGTLSTGLTVVGAPAWLSVLMEGLVLLAAVLLRRQEIR